MKLKQLRLFDEIYATGSLTTAATRIFVSQPAASKILANLEQEVGYKLFHRKSSMLQATPEADRLHEEVHNILLRLDQLEDNFRREGRGARGQITIAGTSGLAIGYLTDLVYRFQQKHDDTNIHLRIRNSLAIREMVASGQIDIGLVDIGRRSNRYDMKTVTMRCHCALHRNHPLANLSKLTPQLLGNINWITYGLEHESYHKLKAAYQVEHVEFQTNTTVNSAILALEMVSRNMGAAFVDSLSCNLFQRENGIQFPNVVLIPFEPVIEEPTDIISQNSRPLSNVASRLLTTMQTEIAQLGMIGRELPVKPT